ncbi:CASTOR/POLLUX-related putative ion channel [Streptomyces ziwulingensis]
MPAQGRARHALRVRARYAFDRRLARSTGVLLAWLAAGCLAVVVPVSTVLVWTDPGAPRSLSGRLTAVWRTSAETLRLGGVTGSPLRMLLSVLLGLMALLCVSTLVGLVTTGLGERLEDLRRGRSTVLEREHAVVIGWTEQVFTVVGELLAARARGVVAVLADRDPADMEAALTAVLGATAGLRIVCRTGRPTDPAALALVNPADARSVLVLPAADDESDLEVVRVLLALRTLLGGRAGPPVVAAVRDARHLPAARFAAGPGSRVLETDLSTARLLAQSARRPGLPAALHDLLDFAGAELHVVDLPRPAGLSFAQLALCFDTWCVVGYLRADGRAVLTPPAATVPAPGDRLVVVAHDDRAAPPTDCRSHIDRTAMAAPVPPGDAPLRLLLLGWNRRAPLLVDMVGRTARPGSVLDVVTAPGAGPAEADRTGPGGSAHLRLTHRVADPAAPETVRALDVFGYDGIVVLGPDAGTGAERSDDQTLLTLLMLRMREEGEGRTLPVVAELSDHDSRALAPLGPASAAVVRGELTALLMAQISQDPALAAVFDEIFAVRGGALDLRPAGHYVRTGGEASFATVAAAALERGECAIGYRTDDPRGDGIRICPRKTERRRWQAGDEVLVLTAAPATPGGTPGHGTAAGGGAEVPGTRRESEDGGRKAGQPPG